MNIAVIGAGYVGLVTGACFAEMGNSVLCIDNDRAKISGLQAGQIPIYEPGLEDIVTKNLATHRLQFSTDIAIAAGSEIIFIAVGTPPLADGAADLSAILAVAKAIGENISMGSDEKKFRVIATKSTVPVGTAQQVQNTISDAMKNREMDIEFSVVSNPEFLRQGSAVDDFMKPDRIIIGGDDDRAVAKMRQLYAPFNRNHERVIAMDIASAELTKYAANALLATRISFMNEIANVAERLEADIESVRAGIGADPRIGYAYLYAGCGYGGSCLPKDVRALQKTAEEVGMNMRIVTAAEAVNRDQPQRLIDKLREHCGELAGKTFAVWGLAFKPDTDDMREAPSRAVLESLWGCGAYVQAFDPVASKQAAQFYGDRPDFKLFYDDPYAALSDVDGLIVVTEWRVFRAADPARIKSAMRGHVVIDGRNIYSPAEMKKAGLNYAAIGRG